MIRSSLFRRALLVRTGLIVVTLTGLGRSAAVTQETPVGRPIPASVTPPPEYQRAIDRGSRAVSGSPGAAYWQQGVKYDLEAKLDPETAKLEGTVHIAYANNAPATVGSVWLYLYQNFQKEGVVRHDPQGS